MPHRSTAALVRLEDRLRSWLDAAVWRAPLLGLLGALLLATLSLRFETLPGSQVVIRFTDAFGMALLLACPASRRLTMLLALEAGLMGVGMLADRSPGVLLAWLPGHLLAVFAGGWMLQGVNRRHQLGSSPQVLVRIGLVAVLMPALLSASLSLPLLMLTTPEAPGLTLTSVWLNHLIGGLIGSLTLLPLLLALLAQPVPASGGVRSVLGSVLLDADTLVLLCAAVGVTVLALLHLIHPFVYMALPLMVGAVLLDFLRLQLLVCGVTLAFAAMVSTGLVAEPPGTARWQEVVLHLSLVVMLLPELLLSASVGATRERRIARSRPSASATGCSTSARRP